MDILELSCISRASASLLGPALHRTLPRTANCTCICCFWACLGPLLEPSLGLLAGAVLCRLQVFYCKSLLKIHFVRDCASNCELRLHLLILGLSRASLGASSGALGGRHALQIRSFLLQSLACSALCAGRLSAFDRLGWLAVAGWLAGCLVAGWNGG